MKDLKPFLLYPNARITFEGIPYKLNTIDFMNQSLLLVNPVTGKQKIIHISNGKLQLRRLSSITEEHRRELAEIFMGEAMYLENGHFKVWYNLKVGEPFAEDYLVDELPFAAADYLRENNYDVDGYIEQGKAIEQPQ